MSPLRTLPYGLVFVAIACSPDGKRIAVASKGVIHLHTLARKVD